MCKSAVISELDTALFSLTCSCLHLTFNSAVCCLFNFADTNSQHYRPNRGFIILSAALFVRKQKFVLANDLVTAPFGWLCKMLLCTLTLYSAKYYGNPCLCTPHSKCTHGISRSRILKGHCWCYLCWRSHFLGGLLSRNEFVSCHIFRSSQRCAARSSKKHWIPKWGGISITANPRIPSRHDMITHCRKGLALSLSQNLYLLKALKKLNLSLKTIMKLSKDAFPLSLQNSLAKFKVLSCNSFMDSNWQDLSRNLRSIFTRKGVWDTPARSMALFEIDKSALLCVYMTWKQISQAWANSMDAISYETLCVIVFELSHN